jgi:PAS domain S-box-containing protein
MLAPAEPLARVLVVDDEEALVTALCDTLSDQRYQARGFTSAREALAALRRSDSAPFDILLTDLSMPEMDGVALLKAALEVDPDLAGIIMTGQATIRTAVEAMKSGAHDYILKPFKLNALLPVIARAAHLRRLRGENFQLRAVLSIYELSSAAAFTLDAGRLLDNLAQSASRQSEGAGIAILLVSENAGELRVARVRGAAWRTRLGAVYPFDARLASWAEEIRKTLAEAASGKTSKLAAEHPFLAEFGGVALPMIAQAQLIGVLIFRRIEGRPATRGEIKALEVLAGIGASALAAAKLYEHVKDAEERYRTLFEGDPVPTWVVDSDTQRFIAVNEAAVRNYGWSREEFLAMTIFELWLPEDQERLRALFVERRSQPSPTPPYRGQWRHRRKNGEILDIVGESRPIRFEGRECRIATAVDISDRLAAEARLATLSRRVLEVQETERREVARELHDEIGQALTAVKLSMDVLLRAPGAHVDSVAFAETVELVDNALRQVRSLTLNLRPTVLDDLGLGPALRWLAGRQQKLSGPRVEADIDLPAARLDPAIETACFRIAQEAITNSLRHARPLRISLSARIEDGAVMLIVADDGAGFDLAAARAAAAEGRSAGLTGMEERARLAGGEFEVRSARGGGTEVRARFAPRRAA